MFLTSQFRNELETIVLRNECAVEVKTIHSTDRAFAALKSNGTVVAWGDSGYGGDSRSVHAQLVDVQTIYSTGGACAALKTTGTVVAWVHLFWTGDSSSVQAQLVDV